MERGYQISGVDIRESNDNSAATTTKTVHHTLDEGNLPNLLLQGNRTDGDEKALVNSRGKAKELYEL